MRTKVPCNVRPRNLRACQSEEAARRSARAVEPAASSDGWISGKVIKEEVQICWQQTVGYTE